MRTISSCASRTGNVFCTLKEEEEEEEEEAEEEEEEEEEEEFICIHRIL